MNEIQKVTVNALDIMNGSTQAEVEVLNKTLSTPNFLPTLAVADGKSKACMNRVCFPGDLVLGGNSKIGQSASLVPITWRLCAREWDNAVSKYGDSAYYCKDLGPDQKDYLNFLKKPRSKTINVTEGVEFLMYLPEKNVFCIFFIKTTQRAAIEPLSSFKGRLATVSPEGKAGKRGTWYQINVTLENRTLVNATLDIPGVTFIRDIAVDPELFQKSVELFLKPMTITSDDTAAPLDN